MRTRTSWKVRIVSFVIGLIIGGALMYRYYPESAVLSESTPPAETGKRVLQSPLAGFWYNADPAQLRAEIRGFLENASPEPMPELCALLLPHAGYRFSGPTAGYGVKLMQGKSFKRVVLLGPSHHVPLRNRAALPDVTHIATPLGEVPLDTDFMARLKKHPQFMVSPEAHAEEHSVQIEIPLLQCALDSFTLVPLVLGELDLDSTRALGGILCSMLGPDTLVVASSDFTHYGPNYGYRPLGEATQEQIRALDMEVFHCVETKDLERFRKVIDKTGATVCGQAPIAVLLAMLPAEAQARLLHYDTSGRITNDTRNSVSYIAAAFSGRWAAGTAAVSAKEAKMTIEEQDRIQLLALARSTLEYSFQHNKAPKDAAELGIALRPEMREPRGVFVTLHKAGQLRGCIGHIVAQLPLEQAVIENARSAAFRDPRFDPVTQDELPALHLEISVLTPLEPVDSYQAIEIGRHGMVLSKGGRRAVFLPQVAPDQGWDIEETLSHLAIKAGLRPDDWRDGAHFEVFEAIVFAEPKQ